MNITDNRLYIFNPERDLTLAHGNHYTIRAKVDDMRRNHSLLPAVYAYPHPNSFILVDDDLIDHLDELPYYKEAKDRTITIIGWNSLKDYRIDKIIPWGWCEYLRHRLLTAELNSDAIPDKKYLETIKALSHRKNTIDFHNIMREFGFSAVEIPREFFNASEAAEWGKENPGAFFKAPWSSSGNGVFRSGYESPERMLSRIKRVIRAQGSIMAEVGENRKLDFASEWIVEGGCARYLGLSAFTTRPSGTYSKSITVPQQDLYRYVNFMCGFTMKVISAQKYAIEKIFREYNGPLGIDMLITKDYRLNPCVEVNTRITMGHVFFAQRYGLVIA